MRIAVQLSADADRWPEQVDYIVEAEGLGVDACWVAEAWGADAVGPLAYLAARTERILLGSGVFQLGARSPVMTAQSALTLAAMSGGRFLLGLGASGPQVMEGLHGVRFAHPLGRMRETLDVIDLAIRGERIRYEGRHLTLPLPDGEGKALRLGIEVEHPIPIYLASLSPKMLELTGERADGWLGTSFVPEAASAYLDHIEAGAARTGRSLSEIDLCQGAEIGFARDEKELAAMVDRRKAGLAFTLGGMGSAVTNFYNDAYSRQGYPGVAQDARRLWVDGRRDEAASVIPDEMVLATTLLGTQEMVTARLNVWAEVGIGTVRLYPVGETLEHRLDTLGRAIDLVRGLGSASTSRS
jgi:F420-dependent oxidoreductase-like protein